MCTGNCLCIKSEHNQQHSFRVCVCVYLSHSVPLSSIIFGSFFSVLCLFSPERCSHHCLKHRNKYCYAAGVCGWCLVFFLKKKHTSSTTIFFCFFLISLMLLLLYFFGAHINPISSVYWFGLSVFEWPVRKCNGNKATSQPASQQSGQNDDDECCSLYNIGNTGAKLFSLL